LKRTLARLAVLAGVPLLASCLTSAPVDEGSAGRPLGSFSVSSPRFGTQTLAPSVCTAGDRQFFLGADLASPDSHLVLRLVVDPLDGPAVRLFAAQAPFDRTVVFRRADCRVFHFSLDTTGWRVNDVVDYRFTVELDCTRQGETLAGRASSTHCH
jgi:hypothetical protein